MLQRLSDTLVLWYYSDNMGMNDNYSFSSDSKNP